MASQSPRRRELLQMLGIKDFQIIPAGGEERVEEGLSPGETVCCLAEQKAAEVAGKCRGDALILAADTLVYLGAARLGKPKDEEDAFRMLKMLSGRKHTVYTGVSIFAAGKAFTEYEASDVCFAPMDEAEIRAYIATGEPMDKAGAYGVQGRGALFIERIDGDFFNVMGLPLHRLYQMLKKYGITI